MTKIQLLFLVILIEGYVVLATELLAIRTLIPFVGSGTEVISIIISAVLLPLAIGYHFGGSAFKRSFQQMRESKKNQLSIRKILLRNVISALVVLSLGLSYMFQEFFFAVLNAVGVTNRLLQTSIYSVLFLSYPIFLLGQTVPLVSNYFSSTKLSDITGKMLFFSTVGSFLGSVFSTIILMTYIGVHNTIIVTMVLLCSLVFLLMRSILCFETLLLALILVFIFTINSDFAMRDLGVVSNNAYNLVRVIDEPEDGTKIFNVNRSSSSQISKDPEKRFAYFAYIEDNFITPTIGKYDKPLDILVIGAGGFTIGLNDTYNNYLFVDIDHDLKDVAEKHFLPEKLSANKKFVAASARAFVRGNDKKYDLIIADAYTNTISIPMECITREFLVDIKAMLKENAILLVNMISSPTFNDKFTVRYHNTFASVFPVFSRQIIRVKGDDLVNFEGKKLRDKNVIYMYFNNKYVDDTGVYTDDKNSYSIDRL